jgi:hypothetical protein
VLQALSSGQAAATRLASDQLRKEGKKQQPTTYVRGLFGGACMRCCLGGVLVSWAQRKDVKGIQKGVLGQIKKGCPEEKLNKIKDDNYSELVLNLF